MCEFVCVETHMPWHMCEGHKTTCRSQLSSSTMKILWIKLRLPGLVKSAFSHLDDRSRRFYLRHVCFCTSLPTVHITPATILSCPHSSCVCCTHVEMSSIWCLSLWINTLVLRQDLSLNLKVTTGQTAQWALGMLQPPPPKKARTIGTWHIISSFFFFIIIMKVLGIQTRSLRLVG